MSEVWVITRDGVYRHEILGIYSTEKAARKAGKQAKEAEKDEYHSIVLARATLNLAISDVTDVDEWA